MPSILSYNQVLGFRKAKHLLRRATFTYQKSTLDTIAAMTPSQALTYLSTNPAYVLTEPFDPLPSGAPDGYWTSSPNDPSTFTGQVRKRAYVAGWWWYHAHNQASLKHKLTFFLHTCFTAAKDDGAGLSTHYFDHIRLLEYYAFGNLKTLAKKVTVDNSMLDYLDNTLNNANNPNENYAREFFELFTILKGDQIAPGNYTNYTETDIQTAAKVLSGFKTQRDRTAIDPDTSIPRGYAKTTSHDSNDKTFSAAFNNHTITGQSSEQGMFQELDDFVEMIFSQPETAKSFARRLYRFFVKSEWGSDVEQDIIEPLAQVLIANNFDLLPAVTTLLESRHFYDADDNFSGDNIVGAIVKSPLQMVSEICSFFEVDIPDPLDPNELENYYNRFFKRFIHDSVLAGAGLGLFSPDSVAGYPGVYQSPDYDRHWFSSSTIVARYKTVQSLIAGSNLIASGTINAQLNTVVFVENNISSAGDSALLVSELAELLYSETLDQDRLDYFEQILLDGFQPYNWAQSWNNYTLTQDDTNVRFNLDQLITTMVNAPEFQLM